MTRDTRVPSGTKKEAILALICASALLFSFAGVSAQGERFALIPKEPLRVAQARVLSVFAPQEDVTTQETPISSITAIPGWGGPATTSPELAMISESALLALAPTDEAAAALIVEKRSETVTYRVQKGDTLSFIASDFGVSTESILWANNLKDVDSIKPGQTLRIPPVSGVLHVVKKGDSIATIAKKYGVTEDTVITFNGIPRDGRLQIGKEIAVPDGKLASQKNGASANSRFGYLPDLGSFFRLPTTGFNWGKIHGRNGVDVASTCGTPIHAAASGTVTVSDAEGYNGGFGQYIKLQHENGTETLYGHAQRLFVSVGDMVEKGKVIALMGSTGKSTGCHLHFEVHGAKNPLVQK
ncbi:MAG: peptidoglycan DD-metalloendopeptidase family protein [Patescibacteria group bacterium]